MKNIIRFFSTAALSCALSAGVAPLYAQTEANTCLTCHLELEDETAIKSEADVHNIDGLSCAGCHGGDPTRDDADEAMDASEGFIGTPNALEIPKMCGKCHSDPVRMRQYNPSIPTDQLEKYWTSHHGVLNRKGDKKVAQCVSCHSVHDIRAASDPRSTVYAKNVPQTCAHCHADEDYMAPYDISTSQYEDFEASVHGEALLERNDTGAPACNDCHGNHAATPPGISSIGRVCFQCHLAEGELFNSSPHKAAFDDLGVPECAFCHGNHAVHALSDQQIGIGEQSICIECHSEGEAGYNAAKTMRDAIVQLKDRYEEAQDLIGEAETKGIEVSDEQFMLRDVRQSLINVRKLIHSFHPEEVITSTDKAMETADEVYQAGIQSIEEVKSRRAGFLIFTVVTLLLALSIYLWVKRREES